MIGWIFIATGVAAGAAVVRWSLKGGGARGYSAADQAAIRRVQMYLRLDKRHWQ